MKRIIPVIIIFIVMLSYACKGKQVPGAPYDNLPTYTPTAYYNVNFTIYSTQTPLAGAAAVLVYPDATRTTTGTTNADGRVNFRVSDSGNFTLYLKHSSIPDSTTYPLFNYYNISNGTNDYTINTDIGSLTLNAYDPKSISYTASAKDYIYFLKYTNPSGLHRKITASLGYGSWVSGIWNITTITPEYIDEPGSSLTVRVSLPDYFHQNDTYPVFNYFLAMDTNVVSGAGMSSAFFRAAYADWLFNTKLASAVVYDKNTGFIKTQLQLFATNININNVCVRINKYEYYIGGQWVDHAYYGGVATYKLNGFSADTNEKYCLMGTNLYVELSYPGYSGSSSTKGRLTLDFVDRNSDSRIIQAVIENPY